MKLTRIISAVIGLPIVALILIFGNKYVIDIFFSIVAIISMYEYLKCFNKKYKVDKFIGYIPCILIAFLHVIPEKYLLLTLALTIAISIAVLFIKVVVTEMKIEVTDLIVSFFGICYIAFFISFMPLLYGLENGKFLIWYILISAWGTDTFAYFVGCKFGKHKFTKISPKKSIEGAIGGIIGAILLNIIYTIVLNKFIGMEINLLYIAIIAAVLSVLSQIGDLSASSIKRTNDIKDFGNLIPGHGGMLDRIDSIIFIAPFAYFLITLII